MNKFMPLFLIAVVTSMQAGVQTGNLSLNNTLAQPVYFEYNTFVTGNIPGALTVRGEGNLLVKGRGTIPATTKKEVPSNFKRRNDNVWGEAINFELRRNDTEKFTFTINQLGTYNIGVDAKNALTLIKQ